MGHDHRIAPGLADQIVRRRHLHDPAEARLAAGATRWRAAGLFVAVFIGTPLLTGAIIASSGGGGHSASKTPAEVAAEARAGDLALAKAEGEARAQLDDWRPANFLSLDRTNALKAVFDTVFMLSGQIHSTSRLGGKDPVIKCELYSETGTPVGGLRQTLFKFVPAGQTLTFDQFNMGFAVSTWDRYDCHVAGATVLETP